MPKNSKLLVQINLQPLAADAVTGDADHWRLVQVTDDSTDCGRLLIERGDLDSLGAQRWTTEATISRYAADSGLDELYRGVLHQLLLALARGGGDVSTGTPPVVVSLQIEGGIPMYYASYHAHGVVALCTSPEGSSTALLRLLVALELAVDDVREEASRSVR